MTVMTEKQRAVLVRRLARALLWTGATQSERDVAITRAQRLVAELEQDGTEAGTTRRVVVAIAERAEKSA